MQERQTDNRLKFQHQKDKDERQPPEGTAEHDQSVKSVARHPSRRGSWNVVSAAIQKFELHQTSCLEHESVHAFGFGNWGVHASGFCDVLAHENSSSLVERTEGPEHRGHREREKGCGWRLWWYASSFMPPRSPAGASHSMHLEVNSQRSLCAMIHQDARDRSLRRHSARTLPWKFAVAVGDT